MHSVKDFSEFQLNEDLAGENNSLYEKYRLMDYEAQDNSKDNTEDSSDSTLIKKNNFNLSPNFFKIFKKKSFYKALVEEHFIDDEKTSFEDFKNVFFVSLNTHSSTINFFCEDQEARYFLFYIGKKKKNQLSQIDIKNSKRFIEFGGKAITQDNISKSRNVLGAQKKTLIEDFVDEYLSKNR